MKIKVCAPSKIPKDWYGQILGFDIETEDLHVSSEICMASIYNPKLDEVLVIPIKVYSEGKLAVASKEEKEIFGNFVGTN